MDPNAGEISPAVEYIARNWAQLQPHVQEAILTLIDGAITLRHDLERDDD